MSAIRIKGLTKRFGDLVAVNDLSLEVAEGEFFALLGVNGAGKTTAIRLLTCLSRPDAGDAHLMGKSILSDPLAVKALVNVSPQESAVAGKLTVRENLELIAALYGMNANDAKAAAAQMLQELGLEEVAARRAALLSGGWQRRLSIAMALITRPQILFLDEPTLGLDVLARRELWGVLRALRGKMTVVLTTHYLEEAEALCDRIGIMRRGTLVAVGTAAELCAQSGTARFEDAFVALAAGEGRA